MGSESWSEPERRRRDRPMALIVAMKSSAKPPRVSATRGIQARPLERQLGRFAVSVTLGERGF